MIVNALRPLMMKEPTALIDSDRAQQPDATRSETVSTVATQEGT